MTDTDKETSIEPALEIRIISLNTDKTRKTLGSKTVYQVYFELSEIPPVAWREIFGREWKALNPTQEAGLDRRSLVMHCPLQEIATKQLPALKKAVQATNVAYKQFAQEQVTEEERKADVLKEERRTVEEMAKLLKFD